VKGFWSRRLIPGLDDAAIAIHKVTVAKAVMNGIAALVGTLILPWPLCAAWLAGGLALEAWSWLATRRRARGGAFSSRGRWNFIAAYLALNLWWLLLAALFWTAGTPAGEAAGLILALALAALFVLVFHTAPVVFLLAGAAPAIGALSLIALLDGRTWRELLPVWTILGISTAFTLGRALEIPSAQAVRRRLEANRHSFEILAENVTDVISRADLKGVREYISPGCFAVMGYRPEELVGLSRWDNHHPDDDRASTTDAFKRMLADPSRTETFVLRVRHKDGHWVWVQSKAKLVLEDGVPVGVIDTARDITEQVAIDLALREAQIQAEAANRAKTEFLANISHEIRTPMNAIVGMADLLWDTQLTPDQRKYLRIFRRAGSSLLQLINDILDLSKVEAGHIELESIEFDLSDLIEKAIEILAMRANEKGLELACHLAPDVPCALTGDPNRLHQILVNLISNAIKFTDKGSVILEVTNDAAQGRPGAIHFIVRDTGMGIAQDKLSSIFERFTQADASIARRYGGTGLGLTISRQLAELMQGRIWAESIVGEGSTFHCAVRLGIKCGAKMPCLPRSIDLHGLRSLAVDDHPINRKILVETLSSWNAHVTAVGDGHQALTALRQAAESSHPYGLLLIDCRMPGMDGFQVVDAIRRSDLAAGLTIIMMASDHWADDIARTYDLGLNGYLTKPIRRSDLLQTLSIAMDRARGVPVTSPLSRTPLPVATRPLHILLVEDSPDNQVLVQSYLKSTPYQVDVAEHGGVAVEQFKQGHYDVILMDMNMPVMDGYEATRAIRAWEHEQDLAETQIIALTALALKEEGEKILDAGCNAHLTKPIKRQTLLEVLHACEGYRRT